MFTDFAAIDKDNRDWRAFASTAFIPGIDPADMAPGMKVTISPNLRVHDRSGTTEIHTVVAVNTTHVQMTSSGGWDKGKPRLWLLHEHHFYDASNFTVEPVAPVEAA